jgi:hypothetical protein
MDKKLYIDRILENENLTSELEDSDAKWLLTWGIHQLDWAVAGVDEETVAVRVTALMGVLRKITQLVANRGKRSIEFLAEDIRELDHYFARVFCQRDYTTPIANKPIEKKFIQMSSRQALEYLTSRLAPPDC